jgi:RNA polymerase sigma-70 factor (ECF subfamily)
MMTFAAGIAHELSTPLGVIAMRAEQLENSADGDLASRRPWRGRQYTPQSLGARAVKLASNATGSACDVILLTGLCGACSAYRHAYSTPIDQQRQQAPRSMSVGAAANVASGAQGRTPIRGLATLMDRYVDGDERAFSQLHDALTPRLRGLLLKFVRDAMTAEDLLQATLLKAHLARGGFVLRSVDPDASVQAWYATIARNLALDHLRGQARERRRRDDPGPDRDPLAELPTDLPSVEEWQVDRDTAAEIARRVHAALESLPAAQREIVELHKLAGLSMAEIATRLQIREGAVRVRAHRAYKALVRILGPVAPALLFALLESVVREP